MSLRYAFPINTKLVVDEHELRRVPALREPRTISFNGVADSQDFLTELDQLSYCKVVGETGVGKSTILPKLIAGRLKKTVLVVSPHPLLAIQGYDYFLDNPQVGYDGSHMKVALAEEGVDIDFECYDIVWMSAVYLTSWLVSRKDYSVRDNCLNDFIVFLDEAHESDAFTHIVRTVTPHFGIKTLVLVSATFEPVGHVVSKDKVKVVTFDAFDVPKTWDVFEPGKPWSEETITTNALIYVDNQYDAVRLAEDYERAGLISHRLTSRSSVKEYVDAAADLDGTATYRTVVIVDSSFRSGFNFDVDLIIDSGIRYLADGTVGVQSTYKRPIYNVEFVQTAGRGGRFGRQTTYYMPDVEPEWKICDLEAVEAEAAAYLTRVLHIQPIRPLSKTVLAYENFPKHVDVNQAFVGEVPLTCYLRDTDSNRLSGVEVIGEPPVFTGKQTSVVGSGVSKTTQSSDKLTQRSLRRLDRMSTMPRISNKHNMLADIFKEPQLSIHPADSASTVLDRVKMEPTDNVLEGKLGDTQTHTLVDPILSKTTDDVWKEVHDTVLKGIGVSVDLGAYLYSPDVSSSELIEDSRFFPEKEKSVLEISLGGGLKSLIQNMSSKHVKFALYHCIRRHNLLNLEVNSVKRAMVSVVRDKRSTVFDVALRKKFTSVIISHIKWELERDAMFGLISDLCAHRYSVAPISGFDQHETDRCLQFYDKFIRMVDKHKVHAPNINDWIGHHRKSSGSVSDVLIGGSKHKRVIGKERATLAIDSRQSISSGDSGHTVSTGVEIELETRSGVRTFVTTTEGKTIVK